MGSTMGDVKLDQTFVFDSKTHKYSIQWAHFGSTSSPTLILIHGTPWSSAEWENLVTSLSSRFNIYIYDHPGFGTSPQYSRLPHIEKDTKEDLDPSLVLRAEASAALIKHWKLTAPPHVVAHDNGGLVSLRLLLQHGIEMASLCLVDVVALGPFGLPFFKLVAENRSVFESIPSHLFEGFVRSYVKSATFSPLPQALEDRLSSQWVEGGSQGPRRFVQEMVQAHYRDTTDIEGMYDQVGKRTPTKIVWGKEDAWIPVDTANRLKEALAAKEAVIVERAGHLVQIDQPGRLAMEISLWISRDSTDI